MGANDIVTKDYMDDCLVFADAFNQYIYKGKQVIDPIRLRPLDATTIGVPYGKKGAGVPVQNPEILALVADYRINLIAPGNMSDEEINQFTTSLREVMMFIKYSEEPEKLNQILETDERFRDLDRKAATVISTVTGMEIEVEEEEEKVNMCGALKVLLGDAKKEGMEQGVTDERVAIARKMLKEGNVTTAYIARITGLSGEEVQALASEMDSKA